MSKIINISLCGSITDNWSYQDNLLPKFQKINGNEVIIITNQWVYNDKGKLEKSEKTEYLNENNILTIRLPIKNDKLLNYKFKRYIGLKNKLETLNPEILFVHGVQFLDIDVIVSFAKKHESVKIYVDNHADYSNSANNWVSKNILHKIIWKNKAQKINKYVTKFYGVIPARVDFLIELYKLPKEKVFLLEMGADDEKVQEALTNYDLNFKIKCKFDIKKEDFVIVTGGKIDIAKNQTLLLMQAVKNLNVNYKVKLLIFGSVDENLAFDFNKLIDNYNIQYIGWVNPRETYYYFNVADLVVFPGRHSVFWEQVVGLGKPMVVKRWKGTNHIDVGGNVKFIKEDSVECIQKILEDLLDPMSDTFLNMEKIAKEVGISKFSYKEIARRSVN